MQLALPTGQGVLGPEVPMLRHPRAGMPARTASGLRACTDGGLLALLLSLGMFWPLLSDPSCPSSLDLTRVYQSVGCIIPPRMRNDYGGPPEGRRQVPLAPSSGPPELVEETVGSETLLLRLWHFAIVLLSKVR